MATQPQQDARTPVSLATMTSITSTLAAILKSVGPRCQASLLCTAEGRVLATSDGATILRSMLLAHPLARLVTTSMERHSASSGDGAKTFVWYLSGALGSVEELASRDAGCTQQADPAENSSSSFCIHLSRSLRKLSQELLPDLFRLVQEKAAVLSSDGGPDLLRDHLQSVLVGVLSPHFSTANTDFLVQLVMKALCGDAETPASSRSVFLKATDLVDHFSSVTVKVCNFSFTASRVLPGFLIQRNFALLVLGLRDASEVKFVMLRCGIEGNVETEASEIIKLSSPEAARTALAVRLDRASRFLQKLKRAGVSLILSIHNIPEYVLVLCRAEGISAVSYVEEEDVSYLERVSGKFSLHSSLDPLEDSHVAAASTVQRLVVGDKGYVHLQLRNSTVPLRHLIVCGPTEGMCQHLSVILLKALMSVRMCFVDQPVDEKKSAALDFSCEKHPVDCGRSVATEEISCTGQGDGPSSVRAGSTDSQKSSQPHGCIEHILDYVSVGLTRTLTSSLYGVSTPDIQACNQQDLAFCAIRGGGYFEFLLAQLLREHSLEFRHEAWGLAARVLHDGLLSLPRQLSACLQRRPGARERSFLEELSVVKEALHRGHQCSLDRLGELVVSPGGEGSDSSVPGVLDPLAVKVSTVMHVLQLLQQMLRIDSILSVKKVPASTD